MSSKKGFVAEVDKMLIADYSKKPLSPSPLRAWVLCKSVIYMNARVVERGRHKGLKIPLITPELPFLPSKRAFLAQIHNLKQAHPGQSIANYSKIHVDKKYSRNFKRSAHSRSLFFSTRFYDILERSRP